MQLFTPVKSLPPDIATELGQLIPIYTLLYWQLITLACLLLGVDHKQGRVVLREPRMDEYITSIEDLCTLKKIEIPAKLSKLKTDFKRFDSDRNLYTHGIWLWDGARKQLYVRLTKGNNKPTATYKPTHKSRRLTPEAIPVTVEKLRALRQEIDKAISKVGDASREIEKLLALKNTTPK